MKGKEECKKVQDLHANHRQNESQGGKRKKSKKSIQIVTKGPIKEQPKRSGRKAIKVRINIVLGCKFIECLMKKKCVGGASIGSARAQAN
jgi:hypothetical protein